MIFHIFGGQLSGKTTVVSKLNSRSFAHWDILVHFYQKREIIKENKIDWDEWRKQEHLIAVDLENFIAENGDKHIVIESSGLNKHINRCIKKYGVVPVYMGVPTDEEVVERLRKRILDPKQVRMLNKKVQKRARQLVNIMPKAMSVEEAVAFIKEKTK